MWFAQASGQLSELAFVGFAVLLGIGMVFFTMILLVSLIVVLNHLSTDPPEMSSKAEQRTVPDEVVIAIAFAIVGVEGLEQMGRITAVERHPVAPWKGGDIPSYQPPPRRSSRRSS